MTYEECERLVAAFESATLLKERLKHDKDVQNAQAAGECADALGEFMASMMCSAWRRNE